MVLASHYLIMVLSQSRREECMEALDTLEELGWKVDDYNQEQSGGTILLQAQLRKKD